jgi:four helix bundle protein
MAHFQNLVVYQQAKELVKVIYALMKKFPSDERYALCDQLRRSVISIPSNIAEGMGRIAEKEQGHFINIAFGSLMEVLAQIDIAKDLEYITTEDYRQIETMVNEIGKMLSSLRAKRILNASNL